jgi:hypothetical protein
MALKSNFQASRYLHHHFLLTEEEINQIAPFGTYVILGKVIENPIISRDDFIKMASEGRMQTLGFAYDKSFFNFIQIPKRGAIAKQNKPVIEIKPFAFMISSENKLLENVFGKDCIDFGIDISYPTLFLSEGGVIKTKGLYKEWEEFDKLKLFKRKFTIPAQFMIDGSRVNGSFRIGKGAKIKAKQILSHLTNVRLRGEDD